jgi:hypothetical protein
MPRHIPTVILWLCCTGAKYELGAEEWPRGCLGFAYNLVRPVARGHRAGILVNLLGPTLVFETLGDAAAYREFMTQVGLQLR